MNHSGFSYSAFTSRNYLYLPDRVQNKIKKTRLTFFGTGLCSSLVLSCVRLGFENLSLNDCDRIELSNLNRQTFEIEDIGSFKVESIKRKVLSINPNCEVSTNTSSIESIDTIAEEIHKSDIVINTVDCRKIYFDVIDYASKQEKLVICPFNPGFAGLVICFNSQSALASQVFDLSKPDHLDDIEISRQLFEKYPQILAPQHAGLTADQFIHEVIKKGYFPQTIIGAHFTFGMVLNTILRYVRGEPIILAPHISYVDTNLNLSHFISPGEVAVCPKTIQTT